MTFMRVADHAFNYSLLGVTGFEAMKRLVEGCDCYNFTYSRLDDAIETFAALEGKSPKSKAQVQGQKSKVRNQPTKGLRLWTLDLRLWTIPTRSAPPHSS